MPERREHRVSGGHEGRSERPATGHWQPLAASPWLTRLGFLMERSFGERAWVAPSRRDGQAEVENLCYWGSPEPGQTRVDTPCFCRVEQDRGVAPETADLPCGGDPETM